MDTLIVWILLVCCLAALRTAQWWRRRLAAPRDFLTVVCRVRDEHFLMRTFVPYYLSQGADRIYIIDDGSERPYDDTFAPDARVVVLPSRLARSTGDQMADVKALYKRLRSHTEWVMCVDADEFVYATPEHDTLRSMLRREFAHVDCVHVPWVMFSFEGRERDGREVIADYRMRWNHDARHPHPNGNYKNRCRYDFIDVKSIFRPARFGGYLNPHVPKDPVHDRVATVDSVHKRPRVYKNVMYPNLRERDIAQARMLCNHYRFTSVDAIRRKCDGASFNNYARMTRDSSCVQDCVISDHPVVRDDRLYRKMVGTGVLPS